MGVRCGRCWLVGECSCFLGLFFWFWLVDFCCVCWGCRRWCWSSCLWFCSDSLGCVSCSVCGRCCCFYWVVWCCLGCVRCGCLVGLCWSVWCGCGIFGFLDCCGCCIRLVRFFVVGFWWVGCGCFRMVFRNWCLWCIMLVRCFNFCCWDSVFCGRGNCVGCCSLGLWCYFL